MKFQEINGNRIQLIKLNKSYLNDMHEYSVKPEFYSYLEFEPFSTIKETEKYFDKLLNRSNSKTGYYWLIKLKGKNKVIGTFGLLDINWRKGSTEIGYGLSPDYWGHGYFKEVLLLVLEYLFLKLNFHRIWAKTQSDNLPSVKALKKIGFKEEGILRDFYLSISGKRYNAVVLSILRHEYISAKG